MESSPGSNLLIDTHAHLHFSDFAGDVDAVLHRANEADVTKIITVGVDTADSRKAVELASVYENVWAAVGVHPHGADEAVQGVGYLRDLAVRRKVVAIGECGLDFYRSQTSTEDQEAALRLQIELALELKLPLIFHVREAFQFFFKVLKDYPDASGVVHSFTAGIDELTQVLNNGLLVAVNGIVTFGKNDDLQAAVKEIPDDRLLLETDCPFLSPIPFRGKTNESARTVNVAEAVAELRGQSMATLAANTTKNAEQLFKI